MIRKATLKDLPAIHRINKFGEILRKSSPLDQLDKKSKNDTYYYRDFIKGRNKWCYVYEKNNKIIGFILFNIKKRESFWKIKKVGYIDLIFIDKKARNKGIAKLLLKKAKQIFRERGIKYITLNYQTSNKKAEKIWKKLGFKPRMIKMYKVIK